MIKLEDCGTFSVPSETKSDVWYSVSMELRTCSCPHGRLKGPCKHRAIVSISQHLPSFDLVPEDNPEMRRLWMFIGTGKYVDLDYFLPLSDPKNKDQTTSNATNQTWNMAEDDEARDINVEELDMEMERDENEEQNENEEVKLKLDSVFSKLKSILTDRIEHDPKGYKKSLSTFEKHLERMPKLNDAALQKALCNFGQESFAPMRMSKRKKASMIPVQVTARSRRKYTMWHKVGHQEKKGFDKAAGGERRR